MRKDAPSSAVRDGNYRPNETYSSFLSMASLEGRQCWQDLLQPSPHLLPVGVENGTVLLETAWQVPKGFKIIIIWPGKQTPRYMTENRKRHITQNLHTNFIAEIIIAKHCNKPNVHQLINYTAHSLHTTVLQWEGSSQVQVTVRVCVYKDAERNMSVVSQVKFF